MAGGVPRLPIPGSEQIEIVAARGPLHALLGHAGLALPRMQEPLLPAKKHRSKADGGARVDQG